MAIPVAMILVELYMVSVSSSDNDRCLTIPTANVSYRHRGTRHRLTIVVECSRFGHTSDTQAYISISSKDLKELLTTIWHKKTCDFR
jgi:hypothetical protein